MLPAFDTKSSALMLTSRDAQNTVGLGGSAPGSDSVGSDSVGSDSVGSDSVGSDSVGSDSVGSDALLRGGAGLAGTPAHALTANDVSHGAAQREWLDRIGIVLSVVCAVHCALTPVLVAAAPFLFTSEFEFRTKAVLLSLASVALGWGYVAHRSYKPILWLGGALLAFGVGEWVGHGEWSEVVATVVASLALVMAHLTNARACRAGAPHSHHVPWLSRG